VRYQELLDLSNASDEASFRKMLFMLTGELEFDRVTADVLAFDANGKTLSVKHTDNMPADFWDYLAKFQCNCGINVPFPTINGNGFGLVLIG